MDLPDPACPICSQPLKVYSDRLENTLCEETEDCLHCKRYNYAFAYGYTFIRIEGEAFDWGYSLDPEEMNIVFNKVKAATEAAKEKYLREQNTPSIDV